MTPRLWPRCRGVALAKTELLSKPAHFCTQMVLMK